MMKRIPHEHEAITGDVAQLYKEEHEKHAKYYKRIAEDIATLNIPGEYLEIGSGAGVLTGFIAQEKSDINITAIDLSSNMIALSKEYIKDKKLQNRIHFIEGNAADEKTMEQLGKFDLVYSTFSLHHWEDPEKVFTDLWNAVNDKGKLYIYDFRRVWWLYYLPLPIRELVPIRASYLPQEIRAIFQKVGITKYEIKTPFVFQKIIAWKK